jgi:DNA polymerase I-like protein with 3'-5' exonuclease and polymerase domains
VRFFAWLYNYDSNDDEFGRYHREQLLADWYDGAVVRTPFDRKIIVDKRKALNYLIQSTTSDIVLERAVAIDKFLENKKSFVAFVVHDEIVIDLEESEKEIVPEIKELFSKNKLGEYLVNLSCGKNYYELQGLNL